MKIKFAIEKALEAEEKVSLAKFLSLNEISEQFMRKHFPSEVKMLVSNHKESTSNSKKAKQELITNKMDELHLEGVYPGWKTINKVFGRNIIADDKDKRVWINKLTELGYTYKDTERKIT